ncbi:unnamed protein product, partial [Linum tenue]
MIKSPHLAHSGSSFTFYLLSSKHKLQQLEHHSSPKKKIFGEMGRKFRKFDLLIRWNGRITHFHDSIDYEDGESSTV